MEDERDDAGRFRKGVSGNPSGRPLKTVKRHSAPVHNQRATFDIAEQLVTVTVDGERQSMTLYQANLYRLGLKGASGDGAAAKAFVDRVDRSAKSQENEMAPQLLLIEENKELKAILADYQRRHPPRTGGVLVLEEEEFRAARIREAELKA